MSFKSLLEQTGLLATWSRPGVTGRSGIGEQTTSTVVLHSDIPCRKQTMRAEDLIEAGIPAAKGGIKWLLFMELLDPVTKVRLDIQMGDKFVVQDTRMQNDQTYFNVIAPADAVEEQDHFEIIIEEIAQKEQ